MQEFLLVDHFKPYVGKLVRFKGTRYNFQLREIIVHDGAIPTEMKRRPFLLIFSGPKERDYMPAAMYECEFEDGPTYTLYVSPISTLAPDRQDYQAAFN